VTALSFFCLHFPINKTISAN